MARRAPAQPRKGEWPVGAPSGSQERRHPNPNLIREKVKSGFGRHDVVVPPKYYNYREPRIIHIGRGPDNHIQIPGDPTMSRHQLDIRVWPDGSMSFKRKEEHIKTRIYDRNRQQLDVRPNKEYGLDRGQGIFLDTGSRDGKRLYIAVGKSSRTGEIKIIMQEYDAKGHPIPAKIKTPAKVISPSTLHRERAPQRQAEQLPFNAYLKRGKERLIKVLDMLLLSEDKTKKQSKAFVMNKRSVSARVKTKEFINMGGSRDKNGLVIPGTENGTFGAYKVDTQGALQFIMNRNSGNRVFDENGNELTDPLKAGQGVRVNQEEPLFIRFKDGSVLKMVSKLEGGTNGNRMIRLNRLTAEEFQRFIVLNNNPGPIQRVRRFFRRTISEPSRHIGESITEYQRRIHQAIQRNQRLFQQGIGVSVYA